jgi:hypothetical protein
MLVQLSQVGREQAAEKEGAALTAAMKGAADQKRLEETKESVHRPEDEEMASKAVGNGEGQGSGGKQAESKSEAGTTDQAPEGTEIVKDPNLGRRIDLSG